MPLIPPTAYRAVTVGDKTYWTFTLAVRLPGLGKVRLVLSFANAELTGTAAVLVTNRVDWSAQRIIALYVQRWPIDEVFLQLKALLEPFGLTRFYTDHWGAYERHLEPAMHSPGKRNTQKIERKHLTLRTRIKRLVRRTICFSKSIQMHDLVIGLFVNRYAFGLLV